MVRKDVTKTMDIYPTFEKKDYITIFGSSLFEYGEMLTMIIRENKNNTIKIHVISSVQLFNEVESSVQPANAL